VHKQLEDEFGADRGIVFMYVQTVFEGSSYNTFETGLSDLDLFEVKGYYGFDPGTSGQRSATMNMFHTNGTPYTIIIDKAGETIEADFTKLHPQLRPLVHNALYAP
jgi:hypothetical protein